MKNKYVALSLVILLINLIVFPCASLASDGAKTHWKEGMIIGGVPSGIIGGLAGWGLSKITTDCDGGPCYSNAKAAGVGIGIGLGTLAVGTLIGTGIGALIPKKPKDLTIAPTFSPDGRSAGLMLQKTF